MHNLIKLLKYVVSNKQFGEHTLVEYEITSEQNGLQQLH